MSYGKVWLVGAGPGDVGLLTLKGMEVLEKADVVVYDSLIGEGILSRIPTDARLIHVGKRASHHTMKQEQINEVLLKEAQEGKQVVRLKGGDPFLFGRGGEELELLSEHKIPFEVVPGITSPLAVPAYNGIPVTHRDFCSSLHIITGHKREGKEYDIDFGSLVRTKGTLVFLMGIASLPFIMEGLLLAGMEPSMPAAVLQQGTTSRQKRVTATVATLKEAVEREGIETPAIIIVGKVCALSEQFAWYEKLPLAGCRVLVTRPKAHQSVTARKLREKGAEVLEIPSITTVPVRDGREFTDAMKQLSAYSWIVFTSPTGVTLFFEKMSANKKDIRSLGTAKIAAIGEGTALKLRERGIFPDLIPSVYDGEHLGQELSCLLQKEDRVLIPRAEQGNQRLKALLEEKGAVVDDVATYTTVYESSRVIDEKEEFEKGSIFCAVFTSASTVRGFVEGTKGLDYSLVKAACIGKQTKAAADAYGMQTFVSEKATIDSLIELVCEMKRSESNGSYKTTETIEEK